MEMSGLQHAPAALSSGKTSCSHWEWGWMGPRGSMGISVNAKFQIYVGQRSLNLLYIDIKENKLSSCKFNSLNQYIQ
jgi:hypothetical protein